MTEAVRDFMIEHGGIGTITDNGDGTYTLTSGPGHTGAEIIVSII